MTAPDPTPRPHLVGDLPEPAGDVRYPAPGYPHDDGSPLAIWQRQADDHAAAQRLRAISAQVEAWKAAEHEAFLADAERALQRARVTADLTGRNVPQLYDPRQPAPEPGPVRDVPRTSSPGRHRDPEPDDDEDQDDEQAASLEAAAAALFKVAPNVSRADLGTILKVNSYWAKKLHANRPGVER